MLVYKTQEYKQIIILVYLSRFLKPHLIIMDLENSAKVEISDSKPIIKSQVSQNGEKKSWEKIIGIILAFSSGLIFTANNCLIQMLDLDFSDALLVRSIVQIVLLAIVCKSKGLSVWPKVSEKLRMIMVFQGKFCI